VSGAVTGNSLCGTTGSQIKSVRDGKAEVTQCATS
jgi:hypothetical protein